MTGTIAVTVDGSPASETALQRALELARATHAALTGVFVIDAGWADFIGNDWQSSRNARQGFLDYVLQQQRDQARTAQRQFEAVTPGLPQSQFLVLIGEPVNELAEMIETRKADMLVVGERVFQVCGRPSIKKLPRTLSKRMGQSVVVC
jgi:nucleotide-binding universal stress UspA family protein